MDWVSESGWNKYLIERIYDEGNESEKWKPGNKSIIENLGMGVFLEWMIDCLVVFELFAEIKKRNWEWKNAKKSIKQKRAKVLEKSFSKKMMFFVKTNK